MEIDWVFIVLVAASFLAAAFNAAFSIGGAMIVLAATTAVLPVVAIVPMHSGLLIGSTFGRMFMFWRFLRWDIARPFLLGSFFGTALGARIYFELPEQAIALAIAVVMLIAIWLPEISWRPRIRHPWTVVGFLHSLLSTLFAYGAIMHAVALHAGLNRRQMVATLAGCFSGMSVFKITGYAWYGFDYRPYLFLIAAAVLAAIAGTWLGKRLSERLPEARFRLAYRVIITLTALRLMYTALTGNVG